MTSDKPVEMTIWLKDDIHQERGMGRRFATLKEAYNRFQELFVQDKLYAMLIEIFHEGSLKPDMRWTRKELKTESDLDIDDLMDDVEIFIHKERRWV
jgi:metal-dependent hydrolase (beta-lactamase superfamily II)